MPSGVLNTSQAEKIVLIALLVCLGLALFVSPYLFGIILLAVTIGWAYSMPPFYLKRHHLTSALSIATVRGVLLNAGGFYVFNYLVNDSLDMPVNVKILTLFIVVFSIVISWFKDLPDIEGDRKYNIKTLAIVLSTKTVLIMGNVLIATAYLLTIYVKWNEFVLIEANYMEVRILLFGHILLFILFVANAFTVNSKDKLSLKHYYQRFWLFFFAEYLVFLTAYSI